MSGRNADIAILGGGLAGGLTALALAALRPDLRLCVIESGARCGGNHVWSFFEGDVAPDDLWLIEPLVVARWDRHSVRFGGGERALAAGYSSITGESLDAALTAALPREAVLRGCAAVEVGPRHVTLADGRRIAAGVVIDARGAGVFPGLAGGWQKFVGQMLRTGPHGLEAPVIMDAGVAQHDGFRFVYLLPFSPDTLFVEDTYYSADPHVDRDLLAGRIADYVRDLGLAHEVLGEEQGCLPVVAGGDGAAFLQAGHQRGVARIGARAGLFHPLTSYSLPTALRMALEIARAQSFTPGAIEALCLARARAHWREGAYFRLLARMMFAASLPGARHRIFARFYRQGEGLIARFYAGQMSGWDKIRLLLGRPPVPVGRALAALLGRGTPLSPLGSPPGTTSHTDAPLRGAPVPASLSSSGSGVPAQ